MTKLIVAFRNLGTRLKAAVLPVVLCGFQPWSVVLREVHRPRVLEKKVPKMIIGLKREELEEGGKNYIIRNFVDQYAKH
jgi:hypothetical protein